MGAPARAAEMFPFVLPWDDATPSAINLSSWLEKPAGAQGFLTARDGHLYAGEKRIRIFGVNMAFGANFPTHDAAEKVAARMAKYGINCVRFHHMDTSTTPNGILSKDRKTLDPTSLEKLDYFIAALKRNGIYANLNLHVGNPYPGTPSWENSTSYFKGVDNFYPPMIESQHEYARALLTHVNPYTGLAYTADPAVAFIEINNENGLIMEWNNKTLDHMPDPLAAEFTRQWNAWLAKKYSSREALAAAWSAGEEMPGEEMLRNGRLTEGLANWNLEQHEGAAATMRVRNDLEESGKNGKDKFSALEVEVQKPGREDWHIQVNQGGLNVEKGRSYTVFFAAQSIHPQKIHVNISQAHAPWRVLASHDAEIAGPYRTNVQFTVTVNESDEAARLSITGLGSAPGTYTFAYLTMMPAGVWGIDPALDSVGAYSTLDKETPSHGGRTLAVQRDWNQFLYDTEAAYWPGMLQFIKEKLGAKSLVLGSATGFSPWPVQAMLDVVDAHAYWQHPHFPHRQWDMNDWTEKNIPMAGAEDGGTLPGLALRRVAGKPFLVTEYNHASPNTYSGEAFLEVCAMAAAQDWDGVFAFDYGSRTDDWDKQYISNFFDIDQHPTKMATLPAALALFLRGDLRPSAPTAIAGTTMDDLLESIRKGSSWVDGRGLGLTKEETFLHPVAMRLGEAGTGREKLSPQPGKLTWDTAAKQMTVVSPRSAGVVGKLEPGKLIDLGEVKITPAETRQGWATINVTVLDGADFAHARRWLITATGETGNTGMQWKDEAKTTVGTSWGKAPSLVEGIEATVTFPAQGPVKAWALDARGQRGQEKPVTFTSSGEARIHLSPADQTLWWEVEP